MGDRRKAREFALQILYEIEMKGTDLKSVIDAYQQGCVGEAVDCLRLHEAPRDIQRFALDLLEGTFRNRQEIDAMIEKHSLHWKLKRMAVIDSNILRLASYEILYLRDVPTGAILNEAIEIAKKFGTEESGAFINGILDKIAKSVRTSS